MLHTVMGWERAWPDLLEAFAIGYAAGSVPFGLLFAALFGLGDLRAIGSGNIGATNVLRTGNKIAAACTLIADMLKGLIPTIWLLTAEGDLAAQCAGLGAMLGHCFPVWLRFKGGKGVATFLGVILGLSWIAGAAACVAWLIGAAITRISSAAALIATVATPIVLMVVDGPRAVLCGLLLTVIVWTRHAGNIGRLLRGTEPRIGGSKPS